MEETEIASLSLQKPLVEEEAEEGAGVLVG